MRWMGLAAPALALLAVIVPAQARADIPMAPFIGWARLSHAWVIPVAIGLEAAALKWLFALGWRRALVLSLVVNLATGALGALVYPFLGLALYPFVAPLVLDLSYGGAAVETGAALGLVTLVDTGLELALLVLAFGLTATWRRALGFLAANAASAALLYAVLAQAVAVPEIPAPEIARLETAYAPEIAFMQRVLDELDEVYAENNSLSGTPWSEKMSQEAAAFRFRRLYVARHDAHSLVFGEGLNSTAGRRGEGYARHGRVEIWRTFAQGDEWYYGYAIHAGRGARAARIVAIFDRP